MTAPDTGDPSDLLASITDLARRRRSGSDGARAVDAALKDRFQALGYDVRSLPFSFSTLPGRYGLPVAGLALGLSAVMAARLLPAGRPTLALAALAVGMAAAVLPLWLLPWLLRSLPWGRIETHNLLCTRDRPHWLVMAHRDSKSQRAPTAVRTLALAVVSVSWTVLAGLALSGVAAGGAGGPATGAVGAARTAAATLVTAALALVLSPAGNRSPGALDNATGLAALLAVARQRPAGVGFLITDGEELGLAGARAAVDALPKVAGIINLDGLDDRGPVRIAEARRGRGRSAAGALATALARDADALGLPARRRPLPPFVMVDHEPLAAAGRPALTVLKGGWGSLLRVHSPRDTAARLTGAGAADVARLVATTLGGLEPRSGGTLRADEGSGHSPAP